MKLGVCVFSKAAKTVEAGRLCMYSVVGTSIEHRKQNLYFRGRGSDLC